MLLWFCNSHPLPFLPAATPAPARAASRRPGSGWCPGWVGVGGLLTLHWHLWRVPALLLLKAASPSTQNTRFGAPLSRNPPPSERDKKAGREIS